MVSTPVVVLHVLSVLALVAGVAGRDACYFRAARAADLVSLRALTGLASFLEGLLVRPGTLVVLVTGLLAAVLRGYPVFGFLHGEGPYGVPVALLVFLSVFPLVAFVFLPKGKAYRAALAEAEERGEVTDALRRAIDDPLVGAGRAYEMVMIAVLAVLMVARPF